MPESMGERTFDPTEHRREEFRKKGRFAQAKDVGGLAATIAAVGVVVADRAELFDSFHAIFTRSLGDLGAIERLGALGAVRSAATPALLQLGTILAAAAVAGVLASGAQTKFRINPAAISVKLERLDIRNGFARVFGFKKNLVALLLSLLRAAGVGGAGYYALSSDIRQLVNASRSPLAAGAEVASSSLGKVLFFALLMLAVLAAIDYAQSYFTLEGEMKMTRQERLDESRQQDGDPKAKARMRNRARMLARKRALASVKNADVVVTNPTHVAVALRYGPKDAAPTVIAKGHDEVALRIRAEARKHGIPILENRPLARALDAEVPVGRPIPQAHFAAVAQILAFVYRIKKRGAMGGTHRA